MNYGQVQAQVTGIMNRRDLTANATLVDTFCQQAIARIQRQLRVPAMERQITLTWDTSYTNSAFPIPNDLLELQSITYADSYTSRTLRDESLNVVQRLALLIDHPIAYARRASSYVLGPTPSAGDVLTVNYYAEFPALAAPADVNFLTDAAADAVVYGALSYAADYYLDNRAAQFEARFKQALFELQGQADAFELANGAAITPAYSYDDCY